MMVLEYFPGGLLYRRIIICLYVSIILFSDRLLEGSIPNQANSADAKSRTADLHRYA